MWFILHHGTWRLFYVIYALLSSNLWLLVPCATLLERHSFWLPWLRPNGWGRSKLCRMWSLFFPPLALVFRMSLNFLPRQSLPCVPFRALFPIQSLQDFAAGLPEELLLCPVRSLREYLRRTSSFVNCPRRLFVSPRCPSRAMSKNGISFLL